MTGEQSSNNTILVTGAGGFIGKHVCAQLARQAMPYVPMYRAVRPVQEHTGMKNGNYDQNAVFADITNPESMAGIFENVSCVIHLAGYAHVNVDNDDQSRSVNEQGTVNLLEACLAANVDRFVYISSVLAEAEEKGSEHTAYGASKLQAEKRIRELCLGRGTDYVIVRPAPVYGVGMAGNLAEMIRRIARRRLPPLPANTASMSLIGVEDLCQILILAADKTREANYSVTVTDGRPYSLKGLETIIKTGLGRSTGGWSTPAMVLYAAFSLLDLVSPEKDRKGRRYWQKLTRDSLYPNQSIEKLNYQPRDSFETRVGDILASMNLGTNV